MIGDKFQFDQIRASALGEKPGFISRDFQNTASIVTSAVVIRRLPERRDPLFR